MQDWQMTDEVARVETDGLGNDGLEIDGQENDRRNKMDEKWRTDIDGPEFAGLENDGLENNGQVDQADGKCEFLTQIYMHITTTYSTFWLFST